MKKFTVIGLGNFGFHAAKALFEEGNEVIAIDTDRAKVQAIDPYATEAIVLDATDKEALRSLGLEEMEAVIVSTGTRISISIMICLYLNELGVKRILAKALDPDHEKILRKVGATEVIHPERDMAIRVSRSLSGRICSTSSPSPTLRSDPDRAAAGISPPQPEGPQPQGQVQCPHHRDQKTGPKGFVLVPPADYEIQVGDILMILGKSGDIKKIKVLM